MMQNIEPTLQEKTPLQGKVVDRFNQEKLYIQLTRIFLDEIASGRWQIEQQIPTEEMLCKNYNVSKITVRQALNNLVAEGYLTKIQGRGTFVTCCAPGVGLAMKTRLTEEMFGGEVKLERKILFKGIKEPSSDIREYLKTTDSIYYILSRRIANDDTIYIEEAFIPHQILPHIEKLDITHTSLYSVLQENSTKNIFRMIQTIEIAKIQTDFAEHLDLKSGMSVLVVHRLFLTSDSTPVAYTKLQGRSDRYKFQTEFERIR